jgi:hypothetical protein
MPIVIFPESRDKMAWLRAKEDPKRQPRTILADIYNWFTEGFDTADLKDAKTQLDELNV